MSSDARAHIDVRLPASLHERVRQEAERRDVGPNRIYTEAVEAWLQAAETERADLKDSQQVFCVTFGQRWAHERHPRFPEAHPDGWAEVHAADEAEARRIVIAAIGKQWGTIYERGRLDESHFPRGCLGTIARNAR